MTQCPFKVGDIILHACCTDTTCHLNGLMEILCIHKISVGYAICDIQVLNGCSSHGQIDTYTPLFFNGLIVLCSNSDVA
jgi:hypothetical protein